MCSVGFLSLPVSLSFSRTFPQSAPASPSFPTCLLLFPVALSQLSSSAQVNVISQPSHIYRLLLWFHIRSSSPPLLLVSLFVLLPRQTFVLHINNKAFFSGVIFGPSLTANHAINMFSIVLSVSIF